MQPTSDPRVVYLGGDQKLAYASRENDEGDLRVADDRLDS
jgi:hypothetical protein